MVGTSGTPDSRLLLSVSMPFRSGGHQHPSPGRFTESHLPTETGHADTARWGGHTGHNVSTLIGLCVSTKAEGGQVRADYSQYRYGATLRVKDESTLGALRGLSYSVQNRASKSHSYGQISSGGTTEEIWRNNDHEVTFRFTSGELRSTFLSEGSRIFRSGLWQLVSTNDKDPAAPRR
jgi:hypothetical protein